MLSRLAEASSASAEASASRTWQSAKVRGGNCRVSRPLRKARRPDGVAIVQRLLALAHQNVRRQVLIIGFRRQGVSVVQQRIGSGGTMPVRLNPETEWPSSEAVSHHWGSISLARGTLPEI
jgi:hypothetical protein